jgi:hypothetical protein
MLKTLAIISIMLFSICAQSQQLSQVTFANGSTLSWFSFLTDQGTLIRISEDGKLLEWGTEVASERASNYYAPKLQPYMGRVDYFGTEADTLNKGKVKSIGTCYFTYYAASEMDEKRGRLKSIGNAMLDYYSRYENPALKGKLRQAGSYSLTYYSMSDDEAYRGKLKTVGVTNISYNSTFYDKLIRGKVRGIGSVGYEWGSSTDLRYAGALKSGAYRQNVDGITYILR